MKNVIDKIFDFGSIDLKKLIVIIFILGVIMIVVNSVLSLNLAMFTITAAKNVLEENGNEVIRRVVYQESLNIKYILKWLFNIFYQMIALRISLEILFIVLKGFKNLSHLSHLKDQ